MMVAAAAKQNTTLLQPNSIHHSSVISSNPSAQNTEDLLTQSQPVHPQQQRPTWAVSATTSPIGTISGQILPNKRTSEIKRSHSMYMLSIQIDTKVLLSKPYETEFSIM